MIAVMGAVPNLSIRICINTGESATSGYECCPVFGVREFDQKQANEGRTIHIANNC